GPLLVILLGAAIVATPMAVNRYQQYFLDLGPRDKMVDGERHVTLTGWDEDDYTVVRLMPDVVVLQMANPDVTDETLDYLSGLKKPRELDLKDTKVTDAGLKQLAELPSLQILRLRGTKITADGFKEHLAPLPGLLQLDMRGTQVPSAALRSWKNE